MRLETRILLPIACGSLLAGFVALSLIDRSYRTRQNLVRTEAIDAKLADLESGRRQIAARCLDIASLFSRPSFVLEAYRVASAGNLNAEKDPSVASGREILKREIPGFAEGYTVATDTQNLQLHYHLSSNRSFWRAWTPKQDKSDDLSSFRETVVKINSGTHQPITGVEIGRGGFVIRGIAPVTDKDGKHLGSVEMMYPYDPLVLAAKANPTQDFAVFMDAAYLEIAQDLKDAEKHPRVGEQFVLAASTDAAAILPRINSSLLLTGREQKFTQFQDGYAQTAFPVQDAFGKTIGVIVYSLDDRQALASLASLRLWLIVGTVGLTASLVLVATITTRWTASRLRRIVDALHSGAGEIDQAARQVSAAASEVAQSASQQAAALDGNLKTITQISDQAQVTAETTDQARQRSGRLVWGKWSNTTEGRFQL